MTKQDISRIIESLEIATEMDEYNRPVQFVRVKKTGVRVTPTYLPSFELCMYPNEYLGEYWLIVGCRNANNRHTGAHDFTPQALKALSL